MNKTLALILTLAFAPPLLYLLVILASHQPAPEAGDTQALAPAPSTPATQKTPDGTGGSRPVTPVAVSSHWYAGAAGYARAAEEQRLTRAPMVVYFYVDWCPYCARMGREILPAREVRQFLEGVVKVRVNPEGGPAEAALAEKFGVKGFPSFFVVPQAGGVYWAKVHPFKRDRDLTPAEFAEECRRSLGQVF